ncbi:tripartite tricarboxylate transporter substrate binding protein [Polynucleobacter sp. MWH-HuK1]|uniref:Bug family tripartite tricarboxylate transporter substrate binding protein n=1 Tax=Polynucleobacter sp. MWH-HuK1 TaxID=1743158 RepID=UPI001C0BDC06|nr:tripartite tricarboxylate transporter substrate binding protein [Polynucleobacter sp. MWH-HuK1]MBU3565216.1 tripartite tricarboxylate transporter substrate binding protein [Polynucleobacter sp. MWH-HuK1]
MTYKYLLIFVVAITNLFLPKLALANDYPNRPVKLIIPFPPGGSVDYVARIIGQKFSEQMGQSVVLENKGGASGSIGAAEVAKAKPDGYTLLMVFDSQAVNQYLYKLPYDTFTSFDYITEMVSAPMLLATAKSAPFNTTPELIAYAKSRPNGVTYGSSGTGGSNHLNALGVADKAGINALHVPYKGGGPMLTAAMAGEVDYVVTTMPVIMSQIKDGGKLKALAVSSKTRVSQFPNLPTIGESLPGYEASSWIGLVGPAGLPKDVQNKVFTAMKNTLESPEIKSRLTADGFQVIASTPAAFLSKVRSESETIGKLIISKQIKVE